MLSLKETLEASASMTDEELARLEGDVDDVQIVSRPDGYYWVVSDGYQEIGPFDTREMALYDAARADEETPAPGESLQEAEDEIGIADWIDPDTGEPAEGQSGPRLHSE